MRYFVPRFVALALLLALSAAPVAAEEGYVGAHPAADVFQVQTSKHTCTLIACTMMLRCRASLAGEPCATLTEGRVRRSAWIDGVGMRHSFTVDGAAVAMSPEIGGRQDRKACLVELLRAHPEGVVIYDADAPHAVWLFGYDANADTFYCADTFGTLGGHGITLMESSIRGADQEAKLNAIDRIWYVEGDSPMPDPNRPEEDSHG